MNDISQDISTENNIMSSSKSFQGILQIFEHLNPQFEPSMYQSIEFQTGIFDNIPQEITNITESQEKIYQISSLIPMKSTEQQESNPSISITLYLSQSFFDKSKDIA